jgi:hypothetical protein
MAHKCRKGKNDKLHHIHDISQRDTRKGGQNLEDLNTGGGGMQEDIQLQSFKEQYVDLGKNGSREGVAADEILHHNR